MDRFTEVPPVKIPRPRVKFSNNYYVSKSDGGFPHDIYDAWNHVSIVAAKRPGPMYDREKLHPYIFRTVPLIRWLVSYSWLRKIRSPVFLKV